MPPLPGSEVSAALWPRADNHGLRVHSRMRRFLPGQLPNPLRVHVRNDPTVCQSFRVHTVVVRAPVVRLNQKLSGFQE